MQRTITEFAVRGLIVVVLSIALWYGYQNVISQPSGGPTLYYQVGSVTSIDSTGNPRGIVKLYQIRGLLGRPRLMYKESQSIYVPAPITYERGMFYVPVFLDSGTAVTKVINEDGILVDQTSESTQTVKQPFEGIIQTITSANGAMTAESRFVCLDQPEEGPCRAAFTLDLIENKSGAKRRIDPEAFGFGNGAGRRLSLLGFTTDNAQLLAYIDDQQEYFRQTFVAVHTATGTVEVLERNQAELTGKGGVVRTIVGTDDQKVVAYVVRRNIDALVNDTVEVLDLNDRTYRELNTDIDGDELRLTPDKRFIVISHGFGDGVSLMNVNDGSLRRLFTKGDFRALSEDGQYIAYEVFSTANRLGPKSLYLREIQTGRESLIYQQKVSAFRQQLINDTPSVKPATMGTTVYRFVGLR